MRNSSFTMLDMFFLLDNVTLFRKRNTNNVQITGIKVSPVAGVDGGAQTVFSRIVYHLVLMRRMRLQFTPSVNLHKQ